MICAEMDGSPEFARVVEKFEKQSSGQARNLLREIVFELS